MMKNKVLDFEPEPEVFLHQPRRKHTCVSDNNRFIYILGSSVHKEASLSMERYDVKTQAVVEMSKLPFSFSNRQPACYFENSTDKLLYIISLQNKCFSLNLTFLAAKWQEVNVDLKPCAHLNKMGMV